MKINVKNLPRLLFEIYKKEKKHFHLLVLLSSSIFSLLYFYSFEANKKRKSMHRTEFIFFTYFSYPLNGGICILKWNEKGEPLNIFHAFGKKVPFCSHVFCKWTTICCLSLYSASIHGKCLDLLLYVYIKIFMCFKYKHKKCCNFFFGMKKTERKEGSWM